MLNEALSRFHPRDHKFVIGLFYEEGRVPTQREVRRQKRKWKAAERQARERRMLKRITRNSPRRIRLNRVIHQLKESHLKRAG